MGVYNTDPKHTASAAAKLAITVSSKVVDNVLRVDEKGDQYASAIYSGNGFYKKMGDAFAGISAACKTALANSGLKSGTLGKELRQAKKKADGRVQVCKARRTEMENKYDNSKQLYLIVEKEYK